MRIKLLAFLIVAIVTGSQSFGATPNCPSDYTWNGIKCVKLDT